MKQQPLNQSPELKAIKDLMLVLAQGMKLIGASSIEALYSFFADGAYITLPYADILYFEAKKGTGNTVIVCRDTDKLYVKYTITKPLHVVEQELGTSIFKRVHRSYIVNLQTIVKLVPHGKSGAIYYDHHGDIPPAYYSASSRHVVGPLK